MGRGGSGPSSSTTRCRWADDEQRPDDYVEQLSATTGMPFVMVRRNMQRVAAVMEKPGRDSARPHARPRSRLCSIAGSARCRARRSRFYPRTDAPRRRAAEQLARCARSVGAGGRAEDCRWSCGPGAPSRGRHIGSLQALMKGRRAGRRAQLLSERPWPAPAKIVAAVAGASMFFRRRREWSAPSRAIRASSCTDRGTSKILIGRDQADRWRDFDRSHRRVGG